MDRCWNPVRLGANRSRSESTPAARAPDSRNDQTTPASPAAPGDLSSEQASSGRAGGLPIACASRGLFTIARILARGRRWTAVGPCAAWRQSLPLGKHTVLRGPPIPGTIKPLQPPRRRRGISPRSKHPLAEPEAFRLPAPQRGLFTIARIVARGRRWTAVGTLCGLAPIAPARKAHPAARATDSRNDQTTPASPAAPGDLSSEQASSGRARGFPIACASKGPVHNRPDTSPRPKVDRCWTPVRLGADRSRSGKHALLREPPIPGTIELHTGGNARVARHRGSPDCICYCLPGREVGAFIGVIGGRCAGIDGRLDGPRSRSSASWLPPSFPW